MSIEKNIESIAASLASIAASLANKEPLQALAPVVQPVLTPAQTIVPSPEPAQKLPPQFAQPAFAVEPAPTAVVQLPFSDTAGFTQYLIASFQKLEAKAPGTGGNIQRVIESIGCKNVNEVQPGSWVAVYAEVEKLVN